MGTPSSTALSYFEPAFSPATTKFVYFDTEDDTLPPAARTASAASSLVRPGSVPVITTVTPASSRDAAASVVEWARERFDEATAGWCFDRLPEPGEDPGWLHGQRAEWRESGLAWDDWLRSWAQAEKLHTGQDILNRLDGRFDRETLGFGPYFFADLAATSEADEQAAINAGLIQANRIQYAGRRGG